YLTCWGANDHLQIGGESGSLNQVIGDDEIAGYNNLGHTSFNIIPGGVTSLSAMAVGFSHACFTEYGTANAWCWGNGAGGQLGTDSTSDEGDPTSVSAASDGTFGEDSWIAAGDSHTCAWSSTGATQVMCAGGNSQGQLGRNSDDDDANF